jgi:phage shock protein C
MTAAPAPSAAPQAPSESTPRRLHRSRTDRVLAGVCGGIAAYYGSDPTAVRLATLVLGLFTGVVPMTVLYVIAAIVIPDQEGAEADGARAPVAPGQIALLFGALLVVIGIAGLANVWLDVAWENVWPVALIVLGGALLLTTARAQR